MDKTVKGLLKEMKRLRQMVNRHDKILQTLLRYGGSKDCSKMTPEEFEEMLRHDR